MAAGHGTAATAALNGRRNSVAEPVSECELYRVPGFARALDIAQKTAWAMIASQRIAVVRIGRSVRIPASEVRRLISEGTTPARREH